MKRSLCEHVQRLVVAAGLGAFGGWVLHYELRDDPVTMAIIMAVAIAAAFYLALERNH